MANWTVPIDALVKRAGGRIDTVVRKITLDAWAGVVQTSPVDTGRFKANWNASHGAPDATYTFSTNQARGAMEARKALTLPVGGVNYLTNGLPYARRLEYGWSKQAASGVVRVTVQRIASSISRQVR